MSMPLLPSLIYTAESHTQMTNFAQYPNTPNMSYLTKITALSIPAITQKNFFKTYGKQLKVGVPRKAKSETSLKMVPSIG